MKVTVKSLTKEESARRDYRQALGIDIDGKQAFCVSDGESEDATLNRDFNDCYQVPNLMRQAHEAGAKGAPFEIEKVEVDEI